ncbi:MAG: hypothetical protein R3B90_10430 [Planctomycetaceae bacterium]
MAVPALLRDRLDLPGGLRPRRAADAPRKPGLHLVGWLSVTYAVVLLPVSLLPKFVGIAGAGYSLSAVLLGIVYLLASIDFLRNESRSTARRLLLTSLIYLPTLLVALTIDHWRLIH